MTVIAALIDIPPRQIWIIRFSYVYKTMMRCTRIRTRVCVHVHNLRIHARACVVIASSVPEKMRAMRSAAIFAVYTNSSRPDYWTRESRPVFISKFPNSLLPRPGLRLEIVEESRWKFSQGSSSGTLCRGNVHGNTSQGDRRTALDRLSAPLLKRSSRIKRFQTGTRFLEVEIEERWSPFAVGFSNRRSSNQSTLQLEFPSLRTNKLSPFLEPER